MKKSGSIAFVFALVVSVAASAWAGFNEYGVIRSTFAVELDAYGAFYRTAYYDGDNASLDDEESQLNLLPTIRIRPVRGLEFSFTYPVRDDGMKDATGVWGPILGFKYGSPSSAGFVSFVFPAGSKKLLGNGDKPSPALIFGGSSLYGNPESFGVRLHSWYFWDFNDYSGDELYFLVRPEFDFGMIRVGLGFPFEFLFGSDDAWISNAPGNVRAVGYSSDGDFGYTMSISIEPKVTIRLGTFDVEPYFSIPLWEYTNESAVLVDGFTLGASVRFGF